MWRQQHRKVVPGHFLLRGGGRHMSQQRAVARSKSLYRERGRARGLGDHTPLLFSISPVLISLTATTHLPQYITSLCPQPLWAKRHPLFLLDRWLHSKSITHLSHSNNLQLTNTLLFVRRPCKFWKSEYWFQWLEPLLPYNQLWFRDNHCVTLSSDSNSDQFQSIEKLIFCLQSVHSAGMCKIWALHAWRNVEGLKVKVDCADQRRVSASVFANRYDFYCMFHPSWM